MICGITTAPRDQGAYYLEKTISSLRDADARFIDVSAEPGSKVPGFENPYSPDRVYWNAVKLGNWGNFRANAERVLALANEANEKFVVTCEDDVVFHPDALKFAHRELTRLQEEGEKVGFLALYTSSIYQRAIPEGTHYYRAKSLWGACALAWPVESLRAVLDHPFAQKWRGMGPNPPSVGHPDICHADTCIGETIIKLGLKSYFLKPCYAFHCGVISSLRKVKLTPERQCSHFAGGDICHGSLEK